MKTKTLIWIIVGCILFIVLGYLGYLFFMKHQYSPGIKNLSKHKIALVYCSYNNDDVSELADIIGSKLKVDKIKLEPVKPYSNNNAEFIARIKQENSDLSKVDLLNGSVYVKKYDLFVFATPVIEDKPCPVVQKFVLDHQKDLENKPYTTVVRFNDNQTPKNALLFFSYKLYNSIKKPSFVTKVQDKKQLEYEFNLWFDSMKFSREELR